MIERWTRITRRHTYHKQEHVIAAQTIDERNELLQAHELLPGRA
jgi:hypothetical protein